MRCLQSVITIAGASMLALAIFGASACNDESLCPFPDATAVEIAPPTACLHASVETCIDPTLVVRNDCPSALYLPTEYGRFGPDGAVGADIELLSKQTARFVIRPEKATSSTSTRKEWTIPARVGTDQVAFKFATLAAPK